MGIETEKIKLWSIISNIRNGESMEKEILVERYGSLARVILHRPQKLNALHKKMLEEFREVLEDLKKDENIQLIVLEGSGEKAFCAGGDIKILGELFSKGNVESVVNSLAEEYKTVSSLSSYPKAVIAYMDGITMGGGAGLSRGAGIRIATERTRWAMPEMKIGLFPDVGMSYYFSRMEDEIGSYLTLSSKSIDAKDCLFLDIANSYLLHTNYEACFQALQNCDWRGLSKEEVLEKAKKILERYEEKDRTSSLEKEAKEIKKHFSLPSLPEIEKSLAESNTDFAKRVLEEFKGNSPLSMVVSLEQIRRAKELSLEECLDMDVTLARSFFQGKDIFEGIRAVVLEKTKDPKWEYTKSEDIPRALVVRILC